MKKQNSKEDRLLRRLSGVHINQTDPCIKMHTGRCPIHRCIVQAVHTDKHSDGLRTGGEVA